MFNSQDTSSNPYTAIFSSEVPEWTRKVRNLPSDCTSWGKTTQSHSPVIAILLFPFSVTDAPKWSGYQVPKLDVRICLLISPGVRQLPYSFVTFGNLIFVRKTTILMPLLAYSSLIPFLPTKPKKKKNQWFQNCFWSRTQSQLGFVAVLHTLPRYLASN